RVHQDSASRVGILGAL
ncbi:hypothetical protein BN1723_020229, partial [Verticillium longisporum]